MANNTDDDGSAGGDDRAQRLSDQAERLTRLRKTTRLSRERFAAKLGLHFNTIANWELGRSEISRDNAETVARILRVPLGEVLGYEVPAPNPVATDETVRELFGTVMQRIDGLRYGDGEPEGDETPSLRSLREETRRELAAQREVLDAVLLEVRALARLLRGEALPGTSGGSSEAPPSTQDRPGR